MSRMPTRQLPVVLLTVIAIGRLSVGLAQDPTLLENVGPLSAAVSVAKHLNSPDRPVRVRFMLHNTSDHVVEVPWHGLPDAAGVALPLQVVLGSADSPALSVRFGDNVVTAALPDVQTAGETGLEVLRLAPWGSVGTEVDLRDFFRTLRYTGEYRLEWRPLDGRAGTAGAEFRIESRKEAIVVTDKGKLTFALMYDEAPQNVAAFLELTRSGFYDGKTIHRIIPGFLIQGGCPKGDGTGVRPDGRLLPAEFHGAAIDAGTLAMARKPSTPDSASCQFFVALARLPELDGQYTVIGQATDEESLRTLRAISAEPTDRSDRPRIPLVIRSINLVDAAKSGTTRFDVQTGRSQRLSSDGSAAQNP